MARRLNDPTRTAAAVALAVGALISLWACRARAAPTPPAATAPAPAPARTTYYVDAAGGSDGNDGLSGAAAWRTLRKVNAAPLQAGDTVRFQRGCTWRGQLVPHSGGPNAPITYSVYGQGDKPALLGSVSRDTPGDWRHEGGNVWATAPLDVDVGNVIFDHGEGSPPRLVAAGGPESTGVKKWRPQDLRRPGDYWYAGDTRQVKLYSEGNPAERHRSIELALRRHIIDEGGRGYVTYDGLALRYGAAHGIGGGSTHHVTVRDCDLSYIGGGHQFTAPGGRPVRFGNAIEFWAGAHDNLVEGCRIWEVYDAALTNQGSGQNVQRNITYRNNVIWNCEYSFEYWNRDQHSRTENIRFVHNTCVNAGRGWGHAQRPDPNGRHLMFYSNTAKTADFHVLDNIFYDATESCLRLGRPDWSAALTMDHNCWFQPQGPIVQWLERSFGAEQLAEYRKLSGKDAHSIVADPRFVDAAARDYRLSPDSPARRIGSDGKPLGALP